MGNVTEVRTRLERLAAINGHNAKHYLSPRVSAADADGLVGEILVIDDDRTPQPIVARHVLERVGRIQFKATDHVRVGLVADGFRPIVSEVRPSEVAELISHVRAARSKLRGLDRNIAELQKARAELAEFLAGR